MKINLQLGVEVGILTEADKMWLNGGRSPLKNRFGNYERNMITAIAASLMELPYPYFHRVWYRFL